MCPEISKNEAHGGSKTTVYREERREMEEVVPDRRMESTHRTAVTEVKVRTDIYKCLEEPERVERSRWGDVPGDTSEAMGRNKKVRRRKMSIQPAR